MRAARDALRLTGAFTTVARARLSYVPVHNTQFQGWTNRSHSLFDTNRTLTDWYLPHGGYCENTFYEKRSLMEKSITSARRRLSCYKHTIRSFHGTSPLLAAKLPTSAKMKLEKEKEESDDRVDEASSSSFNDSDEFKRHYEFSDDRGVLGSSQKSSLDTLNDQRALNAVNVAVKANTLIFCTKLAAFGFTGSSVMLAEAVHSAADILNQSLLLLGIKSSTKAPDSNYNYGYRRERFVWSLISAVGVFFMGSGVSVAHGVHTLWNPAQLEHAWVGISVLGASAVIDAYSLKVAFDALADNAKSRDMTLSEFVNSGHDPTSVAVVAEDAAAVTGCGIAAAALLAAHTTGDVSYDAMGSIAVGGLLGLTATYLINSNRLLLLGRSLGDEKMKRVVDAIRADPVVNEVYRAKSEELGPGSYRFVAEIEFSGAKVVERYLEGGDGAKRKQLHSLFQKAVAAEKGKRETSLENISERDMSNPWEEEHSQSSPEKQMDAALRMYGEEVVAAVGDEVDRMEKNIVRVEPTIHYVDLETN